MKGKRLGLLIRWLELESAGLAVEWAMEWVADSLEPAARSVKVPDSA